MAQISLEGMRVAIVVTDDFEQIELTAPRRALRDSGAEALIVAPKTGQLQGMNHDEKADLFDVDLVLKDTDPEDFDALMLPGGVINADQLRIVPEAQVFARKIDQAGKPIAVICHGPWLLVSARLVCGRRMTSYHTIQDDLRNAGAQWEDLEVVRDRNWVSSRQPADIPAFNREMVTLFAEHRKEAASARAEERHFTRGR